MNPGYIEFESRSENAHFDGLYDIEPQELSAKTQSVCLVDVRQPDEFTGELGHIPAAQLVVLDTLPEQLHKLPKDKTIVFVCRSGGRSARAAAFAKMNGYEHVYNLRGGMLLWNQLSLPTSK